MAALLSGGLDLSIIATANLAALAVVAVPTFVPPGAGGLTPTALQPGAVLASFGAAALVGLLNGVLAGCLRVSPILATLGTMTLVKGLAVGLTRQRDFRLPGGSRDDGAVQLGKCRLRGELSAGHDPRLRPGRGPEAGIAHAGRRVEDCTSPR